MFATAAGNSAEGQRVLKALGRTVLLVVVLAIAATAWVGVRGVLAYRHLQHVQSAAPALQSALTSGNVAVATRLGNGVEADAAAARRLTGDPVWGLATRLPVVGHDLAAARTLARGTDLLARGALPPMTRVSRMISAPTGGRPRPLAADLTLLRGACGDIVSTGTAVTAADDLLRGIATAGLDPRVATAVRTLQARTTAGSATLGTAGRACAVLPAMLDPATPKTYLLLFQNLAEARSLGGIAGAYAVVRADHGVLTMTGQGAGAQLKQFGTPVLDLDPAYPLLFSDQPGRFFLDTTTTPYFPDTARLAREMWRRHTGQTVDGVISVDPVALSYLLRATGPLRVAGGPVVTADNAAALLQNGVYFRYPDPVVEDRVFARTAVAVFRAVTAYRGSPRALVTALTQGAEQRRLLVWSADPAVTRAVSGTAVEGVPGAGGSGGRDVGVYLNNGTASKLSWYISRQVALSRGAAVGTYRSLAVALTLRSSAPASGLPSYVSGGSRGDVDRVIVLVLAPTGGSVVSATVDGRPVTIGSAILHGRVAVTFPMDIRAGSRQAAVVTLLVTGSPGLELQPLAR